MDLQHLTIIIKDSEKEYFHGKAQSLSSMNEKGTFDILPMHSNFISIINSHVAVVDDKGHRQEWKVDKAVIRAYENTIEVLMGIETIQ